MHSPITAEATKFYDERYAGNYMDTDAYGVWGHGNLRTWQVLKRCLRQGPTTADIEASIAALLRYFLGKGASGSTATLMQAGRPLASARSSAGPSEASSATCSA